MDKKTFIFWYRWLITISVLSMLIGLVIAFLPNSIVFDSYNAKLASLFFDGEIPTEAEKMKSFLFGPIGGTVSGYFVLQFFIVLYPFKRGEKWAWYAIISALLCWFFIDSAISIAHGAYFNVYMVNLMTLVLNGIPLILTYRYFHRKDQTNG